MAVSLSAKVRTGRSATAKRKRATTDQTYDGQTPRAQRCRYQTEPCCRAPEPFLPGLWTRDVIQEPVRRIVAEGERQIRLVAVATVVRTNCCHPNATPKLVEAEAGVAEGDGEVVRSSANRIRQIERQAYCRQAWSRSSARWLPCRLLGQSKRQSCRLQERIRRGRLRRRRRRQMPCRRIPSSQ